MAKSKTILVQLETKPPYENHWAKDRVGEVFEVLWDMGDRYSVLNPDHPQIGTKHRHTYTLRKDWVNIKEV